MKKIITFYVLLTLKDLEFLAKNNFTKLPFNEIPFTFNKESIEKFAETSIEYTENILVTARLDCDWIRFSEYKDSHPDENPTEFGGLSEVKTNTFNYSLIDKIKIENVFGKDLQNEDRAKIKMIVNEELYFFIRRLEIFLDTHSKEIILPDRFNIIIVEDQEPQGFTDEEIRKQMEDALAEDEVILKKTKERITTINSVEEAVDFLINEDLDQSALDRIKNKSLVTRFDWAGEHFGYNMRIRNTFIYPNENKTFLDNLKNYDAHYVSERGEHGEEIIYDLLWRKLNNYETTDENRRKIKEIQERIENNNEHDSYFNLIIKMKLLSYNFKDEEIEKYLELEDKLESDKDNFKEHYYQQKALLARLNKEEKEIFEKLKQDYFNVKNVNNKLKHKP